MNYFIYIFSATVSLIIDVTLTLMFIRVILSLLPLSEDNKFSVFVYYVTEPVVTPMRILFDRLGLFRSLPIDMSFFFTYMLLAVIRWFI